MKFSSRNEKVASNWNGQPERIKIAIDVSKIDCSGKQGGLNHVGYLTVVAIKN